VDRHMHGLFFDITTQFGIHRVHKFFYQDSTVLNANFEEFPTTSRLIVQPRMLSGFLEHIMPSVAEVSVSVTGENFVIRSHHILAAAAQLIATQSTGAGGRTMNTEMVIVTNEFDEYSYNSEQRHEDLVFCLKVGLCPLMLYRMTLFSNPNLNPTALCPSVSFRNSEPCCHCVRLLNVTSFAWFSHMVDSLSSSYALQMHIVSIWSWQRCLATREPNHSRSRSHSSPSRNSRRNDSESLGPHKRERDSHKRRHSGNHHHCQRLRLRLRPRLPKTPKYPLRIPEKHISLVLRPLQRRRLSRVPYRMCPPLPL
jgi:hypothetical protein